MAFAHSQTRAQRTAGSGTGQSLAYVSDVTINNMLIVLTHWADTGDASVTITDTRSSVWRELGSQPHPNVAGSVSAVHYAIVPSSGPCTITQTLGTARVARTIIIQEFSGGLTNLDKLLGKWTSRAANEANSTIGPLEVITAEELAWSGTGGFNGGDLITPGGSWVERIEETSENTQTQDIISPPLGNLSATRTHTTDDFAGLFALFRSQEPAVPPAAGVAVGSSRAIFRAPARTWG